jgi:hypothetical protein
MLHRATDLVVANNVQLSRARSTDGPTDYQARILLAVTGLLPEAWDLELAAVIAAIQTAASEFQKDALAHVDTALAASTNSSVH